MKKRNKFRIIYIFLVIFVLFSVTYSWYTWSSQENVNVDFVIDNNIKIFITGGSDIVEKKLYPVLDYTDENYAITKVITTKLLDNSVNSTFSLKLNVVELSSNLSNSSFKWKIFKNDNLFNEGSFSSIKSNDIINLVTDQIVSTSVDIYKLYIYIDGSVDNDIAMSNGIYNFKLEASGENAMLIQDASGANSPDLLEGLIPVVYESDLDAWVKADYTNDGLSWYDYSSKMWANAVLVSDTNRVLYESSVIGTKISMDDILAFYVWIPRYKYKVWNIDKRAGIGLYDAQALGIDIIFENERGSTGTIECTYSYTLPSSGIGEANEVCVGSNGNYYTHPAFTFGNLELRGFWVGKFELSSNENSSENVYGGGTSETLEVRVLPDVTSWRYNHLSYFNTVIKNMTLNNVYGLNGNETSSHMLTNYEWGAVAYLTNSKYGRCIDGVCDEVSINGYGETANYTTMTGCGPSLDGECDRYNTILGMSASTTGNITGVYDMSGGAWEYTMGNISSNDLGYVFNSSSSEFSNLWYESNKNFVTTYAFYNVSISQASYNRGRLGDATSEIVLSVTDLGGWYDDYSYFPYSNVAWFSRGGDFTDGLGAGINAFYGVYGLRDKIITTRSVLNAL